LQGGRFALQLYFIRLMGRDKRMVRVAKIAQFTVPRPKLPGVAPHLRPGFDHWQSLIASTPVTGTSAVDSPAHMIAWAVAIVAAAGYGLAFACAIMSATETDSLWTGRRWLPACFALIVAGCAPLPSSIAAEAHRGSCRERARKAFVAGLAPLAFPAPWIPILVVWLMVIAPGNFRSPGFARSLYIVSALAISFFVAALLLGSAWHWSLVLLSYAPILVALARDAIYEIPKQRHSMGSVAAV
jgi:hypothetical protein